MAIRSEFLRLAPLGRPVYGCQPRPPAVTRRRQFRPHIRPTNRSVGSQLRLGTSRSRHGHALLLRDQVRLQGGVQSGVSSRSPNMRPVTDSSRTAAARFATVRSGRKYSLCVSQRHCFHRITFRSAYLIQIGNKMYCNAHYMIEVSSGAGQMRNHQHARDLGIQAPTEIGR